MKFSLKSKAVHARAREVATIYYIRRGYIPPLLAEFAEATASDEAFIKYSANQPRVPAGNPDGGQWTSGGGDSTDQPGTGISTGENSQWPEHGNSNLNIDKAINALDDNAGAASINRCAHYVSQAIEAGGVNLVPPKFGNAEDYGPSLENAGFEKLTPNPAT